MTNPIPNLEQVWLAGRFTDMQKAASGSANIGLTNASIQITPSLKPSALVNATLRMIIAATPTKIPVDPVTGWAAAPVYATDDPDVDVTGWTYRVVEPGTGRTYDIVVPYDTPVLNDPSLPNLHGKRVLFLSEVARQTQPSPGFVQLARGKGIESIEIEGGNWVAYYDDDTTQVIGPAPSGGGGASKFSELTDVSVAGAAVGKLHTVGQPTAGQFTLDPLDETPVTAADLGLRAPDVQAFTASGTWTKPALATKVTIVCIGGGGGGGGGRRGASGSAGSGGGGGGAGGYATMTFPASLFGATESVTVGAAGAAGASATTDLANGGNGGAGGLSSFSSTNRCIGRGGAGGPGGTAAGITGGTGGVGHVNGGAGGAAGTGVNGSASPDSSMSTGGGGGGGIDTVPSFKAGGNGGFSQSSAGGGAGSGATAEGAAGGSGGAHSDLTIALPGRGAGGGAASATGAAGKGGNAAGYGAGGGGGGASLNGNNSGGGGTGGPGIVVVISE